MSPEILVQNKAAKTVSKERKTMRTNCEWESRCILLAECGKRINFLHFDAAFVLWHNTFAPQNVYSCFGRFSVVVEWSPEK